MAITPQIFTAKVIHKRLFPRKNAFNYGIYYLALPLNQLDQAPNSWAMSFNPKDHGDRTGADLENWIRTILRGHNPALDSLAQDIILICMPRIFGYVFNPVSFWLCLDKKQNIRAVLCEVNNTFNENHSYLCVQPGLKTIKSNDWLYADKLFHVSPFLKREGGYKFRFARKGDNLGMWIDFYNAQNQKQLITALIGTTAPMTKMALRRAFCTHPLITIKAITLIHWQAIKLFSKGIKYISRPAQNPDKISKTKILRNVNEGETPRLNTDL